MRTSKFVNDPAACVSDAIDGICLSNPQVSRIQGLNVLVRSDIQTAKEQQVTLICGGGSGHEPAHAGYIGHGMLAGAVLGNVFASPPVHAILAAIRVCAGTKGTLLIIKNYTGDRLNFGMATERARGEGINVEMVVVDDDCALPEGKGITGARGVAGTVFVHKVAGAEALRPGATLASVKAAAERTIASMVSYGVAMGLCAVPGSRPTDRLAGDDVLEVGIGIHAEAGEVHQVDPGSRCLSASTVCSMLDRMLGTPARDLNKLSDCEKGPLLPARLLTSPGEPVAVLLNNLGGVSELELLVVLGDVLKELQRRNVEVVRCYSGSFMTSLEMAGFSITILKVHAKTDSSLLGALDLATSVNIWRVSPLLGDSIQSLDIEYNANAKAAKPEGGGVCEKACTIILVSVCKALVEASDLLNEYDGVCGDGDCGRVMLAAASHILQRVEEGVFAKATTRASFCFEVAEAVSEAMGGTSGAIAEIMFRAMTTYFATTAAEFAQWSTAFAQGVTAVRHYGGAEVGMRTLLDALVPAVEAMEVTTSNAGLAEAALAAAKLGMERTKEMDSLAGRSNYVTREQLRGTPDPGAYAVFLAFQAASFYFK